MSDSDEESSIIINDEYESSFDDTEVIPSNINENKNIISSHIQPNKGDNTKVKEIKDFDNKSKEKEIKNENTINKNKKIKEEIKEIKKDKEEEKKEKQINNDKEKVKIPTKNDIPLNVSEVNNIKENINDKKKNNTFKKFSNKNQNKKKKMTVLIFKYLQKKINQNLNIQKLIIMKNQK